MTQFGLNNVKEEEGRFSLIQHLKLDLSVGGAGSSLTLHLLWGNLIERNQPLSTWVFGLPKLKTLYIDFRGRPLSNQGQHYFVSNLF